MLTNQQLVAEMPGLRKFAYKLTGNVANAEDLLQNTLLRALEKKALFEDGLSVFSWVSKMMYNLFVSDYRTKVRFESQYDPELAIANASVTPDYETTRQVEQVGKAMHSLPETQRDVLMMVCIHNMSYEDVAAKLNVPVGTVRSRLSRAREALKAKMNMAENETATLAPTNYIAGKSGYDLLAA